MKKFYLLMGAALLSAASATADVNASVLKERTDQPEFKLTRKSTSDLKNSLKSASSASLSSASKSNVRKADSEWVSIGTGYYTDVVLAGFFNGLEETTFEAEFEQNVADPTTYRIVNPYANWESPYTNVVYNPDMTNYLVIHVVNDQYAYIEDFNTGVEFVDEETSLSEGDDYYLKVLSQANDLITRYGFSTVLSACPTVLGQYEDGVISFPNPKFTLSGSQYYSFLLAWADTSDGYWGTNISGNFQIVLPGTEVKETEWVFYKKAKYTDDVLASLFSDVDSETLDVNIEVDADDPNHYRIPNPYINNTSGFNVTTNGVIEYNVYDDKYVYITKLNTGVLFNGTELTAKLQISSLVPQYGVETCYQVFPDAFPKYDNGVITLPTYFEGEDEEGTYEIATLLLPYGGTNYTVNRDGLFCIYPEEEEEDPYTWKPVGKVMYTDDFLASFLDGVEVSTFEVELLQDAEDLTHFSIRDPYANWENDTYKVTYPGVAEFYVYDKAYAYFTKFVTGVTYNDVLLEVSQNVMGPINAGMALDEIVTLFPESLCKYENEMLTATTVFDNGGTDFSVFQIPYDNKLNRVNLNGSFALQLPKEIISGVKAINATDDAAATYYNLQGVKVANPASGIYIRVSGDKAEKVIL